MFSKPGKAAGPQGGGSLSQGLVVRPPPGCATSAITSTSPAELAPEYDAKTSFLREAHGDNGLRA